MQNMVQPSQETTKNNNNLPTWRQRYRLGFQLVAIGLGAAALITLLFCQLSFMTALPGIGFALLCVVFNITAWA